MGSIEGEGGRIFFRSKTFNTKRFERRGASVKAIAEPVRELPVHNTECHVPVVEGDPADTAATVAVARQSADVALLERYNYLGRLSTDGLPIRIYRMSDRQGQHIIRGFAEHMLSRLTHNNIAGLEPRDWIWRDAEKVAY